MSVSNNDCVGFDLTLKACYRFMNSQRSNPSIMQDNICDEPFNQYLVCLKVIYFLLLFYYIIGMTVILWMSVNHSKRNMTSVLILGSETNFLKEAMMTLCVRSS